jgi:hypothetical protein
MEEWNAIALIGVRANVLDRVFIIRLFRVFSTTSHQHKESEQMNTG